MASELDSIIKAQRFNELKTKVKNECLRRKYVGSVEEYGGSSWNFSNTPNTDREIEEDHYRKLSIPVRKINWQVTPNGPFDRIINDADLLSFETNITAFEGREIDDNINPTDCSSSCTGTCTTSCTTGCGSSCSGTCTGGCSGSCSGGCKGGCKGSCGSDCSAVCQSECKGTCGNGCQGECTISCYQSGQQADGSCSDSANCVSSCAYKCGQECSDAGGSCGGNCKSYTSS